MALRVYWRSRPPRLLRCLGLHGPTTPYTMEGVTCMCPCAKSMSPHFITLRMERWEKWHWNLHWVTYSVSQGRNPHSRYPIFRFICSNRGSFLNGEFSVRTQNNIVDRTDWDGKGFR
jgi:hypothetical protein